MMREVTKHLPHYLSLVGIILFGLWGLIYFQYDKAFQSGVAISVGAAFVVWGIVHHHIHDELHPKVVLEYIATAALGITILLAIIWR